MPDLTCPACGIKSQDLVGRVASASSGDMTVQLHKAPPPPPLPGMFSVCFSCGAICRFDAQLKLTAVPLKTLNSLEKRFPTAYFALRKQSAQITIKRGLPFYEPPN